MAENDQFAAIWRDAFDAYEKTTDRKLQEQPILKSVQTTEGLLKEIESRNRGFTSWRNQHSKTWTFLSKCMKPVELLGGLTSNALSLTPFAPASTVLGAAFFLIQSCDNVTNAYDNIEELFANLENFTNRLAEYTKGKVGQQLQKNVAAILTCLLQIIGRAEKAIKHGRVREYISTTFFGKDEKVQALVDRLNKLMDTEERLVISVVYSTTQRLDKRTEAMAVVNERTERKVGDINSMLEDSKTAQMKKDEDELLRKNLADSVLNRTEEIYRNNKYELLKKSGDWLLEEPLFKDWIEETIPLLFVLGGPGTGKSFLSTRTISHLMDLHMQDTDHPSRVSIGYFYIKNDEQQLQDLNAILKSIALRFTSVNNTYRKHAVNACRTVQNISSFQDTWKNLFINFFGSNQSGDHSTFIVVDGLDEAPREAIGDFVGLLEDLVTLHASSSPPCMRFAVFGRHEIMEDIQYSHNKRFIDIGQKNFGDIDKYIKENLRKVLVVREELRTRSKSQAEKLGRDIRRKILEKANGLFFWVKLVMEQIYRKAKYSEVKDAIEEAPRELDHMIRHVFERLDANQDVGKKDLNIMLIWVALAKRPLLMGELDVILSLPSGESAKREHHMGLQEHLKGRFASLFKLSQQDSDYKDDEDTTGSGDANDAEPLAEASVEECNFDSSDEDSNPEHERPNEEEDASKTHSEDLKDSFHLDEKTMKAFRSTLVEFSHLRIKEFLLQEGRPKTRKWPDSLSVGFDLDEAEFQIAITCLRVMCDHITRDEELNLFEYSRQHVFKHLQAIQKDKLISNDDAITSQLLRLFQENSVIKGVLDSIDVWDVTSQKDFLQSWLVDDELSRFVLGYFSQADTNDPSLSSKQRAWLKAETLSPKELYYPMACIASNTWLTDPEFEDDSSIWIWECKAEFMIWILYYYSLMGNPQEDDGAPNTGDRGDGDSKESPQKLDRSNPLSDIPMNKLVALATIGNAEKTSYWHTNLGWALYSAKYYDEAEKALLQAITMDDTAWWPKFVIARCFADRDKLNEAVEWAVKALNAIPDGHRNSRYAFRIRDDTAEWLVDSGESERAIQFAYEAYKSQPEDIDAIDLYIDALHRGGYTEKALTVLKRLGTVKITKEKKSLLSAYLLNAWRSANILPLAIKSSECGSDLKVALNALPIDGKGQDLYEVYRAADLKYRYFDQTKEAIAAWEIVLEKAYDPYFRGMVRTKLAQIFFDIAVSNRRDGDDPEPWVSKLKDLSKIEDKPKSYSYVYRSNQSALVLGHWLREFEQVEEKVWRACFKARALEALDMLSDDDPSNDQDGYYDLAQILYLAGDRENATAAYGVVFKPLEVLAAERADTTQAIDWKKASVKDYSIHYSCDGGCKTKMADYKELHACETCLDTLFCEACIQLVKANELPFKICNPLHTFSQVYPLLKERQDVVAHLANGRVEIHKEWVENLKKEWKKW